VQYEDESLPRYSAVSVVGVDRRFRGAYCFSLMMEAVHTCETSVHSNETSSSYFVFNR
jgi:hypothetical protein